MDRASRERRTPRRIVSILATLGLVTGLFAVLAPSAGAGVPAPTCKIKNLATGTRYQGDGASLTDAIADAASGNRLQVKGTCVGNYTLDKNLRLIGRNARNLGPPTLDGNNAGSVLTVDDDVTAKLQQLTVTNGATINSGGGVINFGSLTINRSTLSGNNSAFHGAGIYNAFGSLKINRSTLSGNNSTASGGGIRNFFGSLTITNSTVSGNQGSSGGGIYNNGPLTITNSTVSGNQARFEGGGVFNASNTLVVNNSIVSGNTADKAGGIHVDGAVTVNSSMVIDNAATSYGGGFEIYNTGGVTLQDSSSVSGNTASGGIGGGILDFNVLNACDQTSPEEWTGTIHPNTPDDGLLDADVPRIGTGVGDCA